MEEKKLRPFDLEAAKRGEPVVTREGFPVKIYDFEFNNENYPLCGKVIRPNYDQNIFWTKEGNDFPNRSSSYDLFMAPVKKEGWVNIYSNSYIAGYAGNIYKTKEEALNNHSQLEYVDTVKIEWEE